MVERSNTYQAGNTIRLLCTFQDYNGLEVNPTNVKITFYTYKYEFLEQFDLSENNKMANGVYFFDYKTSLKDEQRIIYEWKGEIEGLPSLKRGSFRTAFI